MTDKYSVKITLAKALKLKNRIVGKIRDLETLIETLNTRPEDEGDLYAAFDEIDILSLDLISLKTAIHKANSGIIENITSITENKSRIEFLRKLQDGYSRYFREKDNVYRLEYLQLGEWITKYECKIDEWQDELDEYNHKTTIMIPSGIL